MAFDPIVLLAFDHHRDRLLEFELVAQATIRAQGDVTKSAINIRIEQ